MCLAIYTRYLLVFKQFICLAASAVAHLLVIYLVFTVFSSQFSLLFMAVRVG